MRLLHAAADAAAFHQYARTAWDDPGDDHRLLTDGQAEFGAFVGVLGDLATKGRFDILLVYLSGHGELGNDANGWFCLADARPGSVSLGPGELDAILGRVSAERVLLLLDCCHAEAAVTGMKFFSALDGDLTRMFVASARARQQSWEDDGLRRSLFSDVLLRALSSDSEIADAGKVDLEGRLVPRLREQVPLNAAARKRGAVQEPVSGGCSVTATRLPTVSSQSLGRELSVAETVRRRARRLLAATAIAITAALLLSDGLAYHLAVAGSGEILLRPGFPPTYGLLPFHLGREADTGLSLADVNPAKDALMAGLGNGSFSGMSGHLDNRGLRPWLALLEPGLKPRRQQAVASLAAGNLMPLAPGAESPPAQEAAFLAALTHRPMSEIGRDLYPLEAVPDITCEDDASRRLDMDLLLAGTDVFVRDAEWLAQTAPESVVARTDALYHLLLLSAYRLFHPRSEDSWGTELHAFAAATWRLAASASDPDEFRRYATERLASVKRRWCAIHANLALTLLSRDKALGARAEAELLSLFRKPYDEDRLAEPRREEQLAALALTEIGRRGLLRPPTLEAFEELARRDGLDMSAVAPAITLIRATAPWQPLPRSLVTSLLEKMKAPPEEADFAPVAAFAVLASNAPHLQPAHVAEVRQWADDHSAQQRTMSDFHRGLGYLAAFEGGLGAGQRAVLEARLSPLSRFPPAALTYRGVTIITAADDDALVALGRAAQVSDIPSETLERLANAAAGRPLLDGRRELLKGVGAQWYRGVRSRELAEAVADRLARARQDRVRRDLEAEVAAEQIAFLTGPDRERVGTQLISRWREEREPELRMAIASTVALVVAARDR